MVSSWGGLHALGSLVSARVPAQQHRQVFQVFTLSLIEPYVLWLAFAIDTALKCLSNTVSAPNVKKDTSVVFFFGLVQAGVAYSILELVPSASVQTLGVFR